MFSANISITNPNSHELNSTFNTLCVRTEGVFLNQAFRNLLQFVAVKIFFKDTTSSLGIHRNCRHTISSDVHCSILSPDILDMVGLCNRTWIYRHVWALYRGWQCIVLLLYVLCNSCIQYYVSYSLGKCWIPQTDDSILENSVSN